jgi:hypothetical protein
LDVSWRSQGRRREVLGHGLALRQLSDDGFTRYRSVSLPTAPQHRARGLLRSHGVDDLQALDAKLCMALNASGVRRNTYAAGAMMNVDRGCRPAARLCVPAWKRIYVITARSLNAELNALEYMTVGRVGL